MSDKQNLEEQLLSQEAERRLTNQLDEVEQIEIDVQTNLLKIFQGQVDGFSLTGQGLVIQENIRIQEINLHADSIAVNPLSALRGQIELNEPVNVLTRLVLTEADINRALNSELMHGLIQKLDLNVNGEIEDLEPQEIEVFLPRDGKIKLQGKLFFKERGNARLFNYTIVVSPPTRSQPLMLESFHCAEGEGITLEFILACVQKAKELLKSPYFEWEDMAFFIKNIDVKKGSLTLLLEAHVKQIPAPSTIISCE